ncbi:hypothetical protein K4L44_07735 [Halosquirtibacter laminarini]|uniref:Uncharacterized protein n=1 Tax=Halosquirtibacter laminarini TaxID=3374600 RepID=A0AC61NJK2_9BACT|nr:hypothetical protein K4L44_07735 [Prolixibacteraceae bacterium]
MKQLSLLVLLCVASLGVYAKSSGNDSEFKPKGKPIVRIFADWHTGFGEVSNVSGFEIQRALLGYSYQFSPRWSGQVVLDTGNPKNGGFEETAYLRKAFFTYKHSTFQASLGIIGLKQFKEQENNWGYRYIYKSAMDEYKFNNSVDAGLFIRKQFKSWFAADITISNGEGAKKAQDDQGKYRYGLGASLYPTEHFSIRTYVDYFIAPDSEDGTESFNQSSYALFAGYKNKDWSFGLEYDYGQNFKFDQNNNKDIFSIYSTVNIDSKFKVFARYDFYNNHEESYKEDNENVFLSGFQYIPCKGIKIAPNYRWVHHENSPKLKNENYFYLNLELKL